MQKIVFEKEKKVRKTKRHSVVVGDEVYLGIIEISTKTGISVERVVGRLLEEALKEVEIHAD